MPVEGRGLSSRQTQYVVKDLGDWATYKLHDGLRSCRRRRTPNTGVRSCPRAGCGKSARPVRWAGCGNGATVEPLRHRQTKGAETDMSDLQKPRHISTLPWAALRHIFSARPLSANKRTSSQTRQHVGLGPATDIPAPKHSPSAIFDYKFGRARLSNGTYRQVPNVAGVGPSVPVTEVRPWWCA